jgi:hypothetical protein
MGLGMRIVSALTEQLNADLTVLRGGSGTEFVLTIPLAASRRLALSLLGRAASFAHNPCSDGGRRHHDISQRADRGSKRRWMVVLAAAMLWCLPAQAQAGVAVRPSDDSSSRSVRASTPDTLARILAKRCRSG